MATKTGADADAAAPPSVETNAEDEKPKIAELLTARRRKFDVKVLQMRQRWGQSSSAKKKSATYFRIRAIMNITGCSQTFICKSIGLQSNTNLSIYLSSKFLPYHAAFEKQLESFIGGYLEGKYLNLKPKKLSARLEIPPNTKRTRSMTAPQMPRASPPVPVPQVRRSSMPLLHERRASQPVPHERRMSASAQMSHERRPSVPAPPAPPHMPLPPELPVRNIASTPQGHPYPSKRPRSIGGADPNGAPPAKKHASHDVPLPPKLPQRTGSPVPRSTATPIRPRPTGSAAGASAPPERTHPATKQVLRDVPLPPELPKRTRTMSASGSTPQAACHTPALSPANGDSSASNKPLDAARMRAADNVPWKARPPEAVECGASPNANVHDAAPNIPPISKRLRFTSAVNIAPTVANGHAANSTVVDVASAVVNSTGASAQPPNGNGNPPKSSNELALHQALNFLDAEIGLLRCEAIRKRRAATQGRTSRSKLAKIESTLAAYQAELDTIVKGGIFSEASTKRAEDLGAQIAAKTLEAARMRAEISGTRAASTATPNGHAMLDEQVDAELKKLETRANNLQRVGAYLKRAAKERDDALAESKRVSGMLPQLSLRLRQITKERDNAVADSERSADMLQRFQYAQSLMADVCAASEKMAVLLKK